MSDENSSTPQEDNSIDKKTVLEFYWKYFELYQLYFGESIIVRKV